MDPLCHMHVVIALNDQREPGLDLNVDIRPLMTSGHDV